MFRPVIRAATPDDRAALYDICLRTGDAGSDATHLYPDPHLIGSVFVGPYLSLDGCIGFVALDASSRPAGYALAALDTASFERECATKWWPSLRLRYPDPGGVATSPDERLMARIHHPPTTDPAITGAYPAHLHLDLLPSLQGTGTGRRLMEQILETLGTAGVPGVHLGVDPANTNAIGFYTHMGFEAVANSDWMTRHV